MHFDVQWRRRRLLDLLSAALAYKLASFLISIENVASYHVLGVIEAVEGLYSVPILLCILTQALYPFLQLLYLYVIIV